MRFRPRHHPLVVPILAGWPALAAAETPPGALPAATIEAIAARDGLTAPGDPELFDLGRRWLTSQRTAELDGRPPREHIVEVTEYTGEGTWQTEYHPYRAAGDGLPEAMGDAIITGGYRDAGYLRVDDLDGDGRDALIVVGDTSGDSASAIEVWRWDAGWHGRWWGPDPGGDYLPFDLASATAEQSSPPGVALVALPPVHDPADGIAEPWVMLDGRYRPWPTAPGPWLGALMAHVAEHDPPRRPSHALPALAAVMRRAGVQPSRPAATQHHLQALHRQMDDSGDHAALVDAMGWPGNAAARPHLRALMEPPHNTTVRAAAVEALIRVGDEADLRAVLDDLTDGSMAWGDDDFMAYTRFGAVARAFSERNDPRARARLALAIADGRRSVEARRALIRGLGVDTAAVPALLRAVPALPAALRRAVVDAVWGRAVSEADHPAWRVDGVAEAVRPLLTDADPQIARSAVTIVRVADPHAADTLRLALLGAAPTLRAAMLDALADLAPGDPALAAAARDALARLPKAAPEARATLHATIARFGDPATLAGGLALAEAPGQLDDYAEALAAPPPSGAAGGPPVVGRGAAGGPLVAAARPARAPDRPDRVRQAAARVLGPLDDDRARAALMLLMRTDPVFYVRAAAARALSRRHPEVEAALIVALTRESEALVRGDIIEALGRQGTPRARATLSDRLSHPDDGWAAAHALARVPDAAGLEVGATLARHAAAVAASPAGCERVSIPIGALARAGLSEATPALRHAVEACPERRSALVTHAIEQWHREGSSSSRRAIAAFADDPARDVSRAAWHALARPSPER